MRMLTREQSFRRAMEGFARLEVGQVIDLCHGGERFPAIVSGVSHGDASFEVIPLKEDGVFGILGGETPPRSKITMPDGPCEVQTMWNLIWSPNERIQGGNPHA